MAIQSPNFGPKCRLMSTVAWPMEKVTKKLQEIADGMFSSRMYYFLKPVARHRCLTQQLLEQCHTCHNKLRLPQWPGTTPQLYGTSAWHAGSRHCGSCPIHTQAHSSFRAASWPQARPGLAPCGPASYWLSPPAPFYAVPLPAPYAVSQVPGWDVPVCSRL